MKPMNSDGTNKFTRCLRVCAFSTFDQSTQMYGKNLGLSEPVLQRRMQPKCRLCPRQLLLLIKQKDKDKTGQGYKQEEARRQGGAIRAQGMGVLLWRKNNNNNKNNNNKKVNRPTDAIFCNSILYIQRLWGCCFKTSAISFCT